MHQNTILKSFKSLNKIWLLSLLRDGHVIFMVDSDISVHLVFSCMVTITPTEVILEICNKSNFIQSESKTVWKGKRKDNFVNWNVAFTSIHASNKEDWYFDSGCSRHMASNSMFFSEFKEMFCWSCYLFWWRKRKRSLKWEHVQTRITRTSRCKAHWGFMR